ncbi:MAG: hypothetical protein ABWY34_01695, partial [Pseudoxanthomonas sp.]
SLGGCLAQITAHKLNLKGETFNAYGAVSLNQRIPEGGDNLVNHVMAADPISAASRHFGRVHVYATPEEVRQLKTAGYDNNRNPLQVRSLGSAVAVSLDSHFMDNFLNVDAYNKPDKSVLADPHARQLAANFDPAIDRYRSDIAFARGLITFVANNPVGNLQESISTLRGDETPGELLRRQERLDRALRFEASHGIADSRRPLPERESPYRPELVKPGGPLSLPEYLPRQDDASRPPLKSDDVPRSKGMPLSAIPVGHPDHALYTELKQQLPAGTSEDRLAQITVAAKLGGVTAGQLQGVHVSEQSMQVFVAGTIPGQRCCVDLRAPPPALEESLRHSEVFDHQQAQQLTQLQVHQQNLNALGQSGPSMTMG